MAGRVIQGHFPSGRPTSLPPNARQPPRAYTPHALGPVVQRQGGNAPLQIDPVRLGLANGGGRSLPDTVRVKMETAFGTDFSGVRVHVGPQPERIGAHAFTIGNDIYFASGRYQPDSLHGQRLLGHELAHVVQQRQGRVRAPNSGITVIHDTALEAEAVRLGERAVAQTQAAAPTLQPRVASSSLGAGKIGMGSGVAQQRMAKTMSHTIQRNGKELAALAIQVFPGPTVEVQNKIVTKLEEYFDEAVRFDSNYATNNGVGKENYFPVTQGNPRGNVNLGSVLLPPNLSGYDNIENLIKDSTLMETPSGAPLIPSVFKLIKDDESLKRGIITNTIRTMETAGQIKYLKGLGLSEKWTIIIEIHYYRQRVQSEPGFHKDSVGETLFVNLNYVNEEELSGPEFIVNPPVDPQHLDNRKNTLPKKFRTHLADAGKELPAPDKIGTESIPKFGVVAFVDELIHHKTPTPGHRKVPAANLAKFLEKKFPQEYKNAKWWYESRLFYHVGWGLSWVTSKTKTYQKNVQWEDWIKMTKSGRSFDRHDLLRAGLSQSQVDEAVNDYSENASGFNKVSIPHKATRTANYDIGTTRLKRTMSSGNLNQTPVNSSGSGRRAFFRTWVRAVRK